MANSKIYGKPAGPVILFDKTTGALDVTSLVLGNSGGTTSNGTAVTSTATELNFNDVSVQTETIAAAGALSVLKRISKLALVGAGAVTLAAPDASLLGQVKIITMTTDNGDVTLALTNVNGGSAATTCTFNDVNDALILVAGVNKWHVIAEAGVAMT